MVLQFKPIQHTNSISLKDLLVIETNLLTKDMQSQYNRVTHSSCNSAEDDERKWQRG